MASEQEVCVCICVDQRFHGWQRSGTVSHRQPFRNVPQPRDGLWSLISRAPSPRALSDYVRHRPSQMHAGGAAASCESFPALSIFLSLRATPGWQSVVLDGFFISLLVWILICLFARLLTCLIVCMRTCLTAFACEYICFSDFCASFHLLPRQTFSALNTPEQFYFAPPAHCVNAVNDSMPLPPLSSTSHVCHSDEAQCGFKGRTSMSCFTLFTINPSMLPSVFTVRWRKSSGKGNIKQSEQYNAEQTLLTHLGISSNKWQTYHVAAVGFFLLTPKACSSYCFKCR